MNAIDKFKEVSSFLRFKNIEDAVREAEMLITETLRVNRSRFYTDTLEISGETANSIDAFAVRRSQGEPLQYVIGHVDFYGMKIKVGPGVLIPRPETELLVEEVLKTVSSKQSAVSGQNKNSELRTPMGRRPNSELTSSLCILDLCTGSGCLALALAKHIPNSDVYAVDISEKALEYARENAGINGISNIVFLNGSLFEPVKDMKFDVIVSNPPYIKRADIETLQPEIRDWEPFEALDGGEDGLDFYREIISSARLYLNDTGLVILEAGAGESGDIVRIAAESGLRCESVIEDYAGIERIICLTI
ncbi:MAG: peptide chain release factor N(5)-glutamine methyltransferase [Nitrospirota bacterium]